MYGVEISRGRRTYKRIKFDNIYVRSSPENIVYISGIDRIKNEMPTRDAA